MTVLFRADSSLQIGSGHIMRCLALADQLKKQGSNVAFICREFEGSLINFINGKGYRVHTLKAVNPLPVSANGPLAHSHWLGVAQETDAAEVLDILQTYNGIEWMIVDHYALDAQWESVIKPHVKKMMVIDDLADRRHQCDILLDQNLFPDMHSRYNSLVPDRCKLLLGPKYALLREEFREARKQMKLRDGHIKKMLVFLGGSDPANVTGKVLNAITLFGQRDFAVDVVIGMSNPNRRKLEAFIAQHRNMTCHIQSNRMAELILHADLAIGAGGTSIWERCCLGLPTLVINIAKNQETVSASVAATNSIIVLGNAENVTVPTIFEQLQKVMNDRQTIRQLSFNSSKLVDGKGIERVISEMGEIL
jgi:UDP-2,4-diacetamido-2,4,6-trideoxy-beta-L-altropyranose hydrolase